MALLTGSTTWDLSFALITLLIFAMRWLASINDYWKRRGIPYVKPIWAFGNYKDVILGRKPIFEIQAEIYNKLEGERFGGFYEMISPSLMVRDPELIEKILVKDFAHFVDRGESQVDVEREPLSAGMNMLTGNQWRHMRYKLTPTFTSGKLKGMFEQIHNCGEELLKELREVAVKGEAVESKTVVGLFSSDVIATCAFGLQFKRDSEEGKLFRKMAESIFSVSTVRMLKLQLANYSSRLGKLIRAINFPKEASKFFLDITKATISYREKSAIMRNDFLQLLITLRENEKSGKTINVDQELIGEDAYLKQEEYKLSSDEDKIELTDGVLAAQAFLFLTAGSETISWTVSYVLFSLATNSQVQERAQREVDDVLVKHGGWTYQAVKDLTYLDQVIQESLRFHPFIPMLMRIVTSPYKIPGTDVVLEKGVRITIPVYPLHKDPRVYPDPDTFNPERFKDNNHKTSWKYLPFGDGPRMCIGMRFALLEMKMCVSRILSQFSVSLSEKTLNPLQYEASFFPRPKGGIWLHFRERQTNQNHI